jgi:quercetin dioxygenase-like cupin family protein
LEDFTAPEEPMKTLILSTVVVLLVGGAVADDTRHTNVITPDAVKWTENPAFPKGILIATLIGDPTKVGETVVQRIKFPPNFIMPPHTHPFSEVVTVVSGRIGTNGGEKPEKKGGLLEPGAMWVYPAKHAHYAWTGDAEAILQVQYTGPGGIEYANPADDPRNK